MSPFWLSVAGYLAGMAILLVLLALLSPLLFRLMKRYLMQVPAQIIMKDTYTENWLELFTTAQKVNARVLAETFMRAKQGKPPERPFGSVLVRSPWDRLLFNPTYLVRVPPLHDEAIATQVTIGPRAKKPLRLGMPVLIAGMSYGHALSAPVKIALARAAAQADTATNTGEGFLEEERQAARYLIMQHTRGLWPNATQFRPELYENADAIEIQIGQGAQAAVPQITPARNVTPKMREVYGVQPGEDMWIDGHFQDMTTPQELARLVANLKERFGVPVGYKFGATQYLEAELKAAVEAEVDFVVIDGAEGGTHAATAAIADDVGLPTLHALVRAVRYLEQRGVRQHMSVIASGGLRTPGDYAKALALGADAVYIGTIAVLALVSDEMFKAAPDEPPTGIALESGRYRGRFDIEKGTQNLHRYLSATRQELIQICQALGKRATAQLDRSDLVALDSELARFAGVSYALEAQPDDISRALQVPPAAGHARPRPLDAEPVHARPLDGKPAGASGAGKEGDKPGHERGEPVPAGSAAGAGSDGKPGRDGA